MKTKTKNKAGHHAHKAAPNRTMQPDPHDTLIGLLERNLPQIADQARRNPVPPDSALVVQFTDLKWNCYCMNIDTVSTLAHEVGAGDGFRLMSTISMIGLSVPVLAIYTADQGDGWASGCTMIDRRN